VQITCPWMPQREFPGANVTPYTAPLEILAPGLKNA